MHIYSGISFHQVVNLILLLNKQTKQQQQQNQ